MFDTHKVLMTFYENHVRLGQQRRDELAQHREACLARLEDGLRVLGRKAHRTYPGFERTCIQGSYAMHTLNQHLKKEYDIDVAVIFRREALPLSPLRARQRVAAALRATLHNFATIPLARTNAVTVWYTRGYHVDLAVYRESTDASGQTTLEHASAQWTPRDPQEVNEWFKAKVAELSPKSGSGVTVPEDQFRRVVRLIKAFARSRLSWKLPGGMILSALAAEVYKPDPHRDDVALYETLVEMRARLRKDLEVFSPVSSSSLTRKPEVTAQMKRLLEKLDFVLPRLDVLKSPACLQVQAVNAWGWVFNHLYWRDEAKSAARAAATEPAVLRIWAYLATGPEGSLSSRYGESKVALAKGTRLRFSFTKKRLGIKPPFIVRWVVRYGGGEARDASEDAHEQVDSQCEHWLEARYAGRHSVHCEVIQDGQVIARGVRHFRITSE